MTIDAKIDTSCRRISRAKALAEARQKTYYEACVAGDWPKVERLRFEITASMESFLDEIAAAHKLIEVERGKTKKR